MRIFKISLFLAFCLSVFLFSCRKDNGVGSYIVKVTAIGDGSVVGWLVYKGKGIGVDKPDNETSAIWYSDTIEGAGSLKLAAFAMNRNIGRIGAKMEVFKLGSGGKRVKVASVSRSVSRGYEEAPGIGYFQYGVTIEFPSNKKGTIESREQDDAFVGGELGR